MGNKKRQLTPAQNERLIELAKERVDTLERALRSIGKNTCGCEPLAAAFARGILAELGSMASMDDEP
jgi:hypothetical protein